MDKVDFSDPLFFLNVIGMHPFKNNLFSKIRRLTVIASYFAAILSALLEATFNSQGIETYARASESLIPDCQLSAKILVLIIYRKEIGELLTDAQKFWALDTFGPHHRKLFVKHHIFLKYFFRVYKILLAFTCLQFVVIKVVYKKKDPVMLSYGESRGLETPYVQMYFFVDVMVTLSTIYLVNGFDGLFFYLIGHILSELQMIKVAFGKYEIGTKWDKKQRFIKTVKHHIHVLEFVEKFNTVVSVVLLIQHLSCLFGICFALFLMSKDGLPPDVDRIGKYMPYIISFMLQTWTFCFSGNLLINWSLEIPNEVFYNDWDDDYDYENVLGRVISMKRGQRPAKLTLGGFGDLDLQSFKLVMQKTFSFFTFINAMIGEK